MKDKELTFENFTAKDKFMNVVGGFKLSYAVATGKRLTNEQLASFLGVKREHFQKLMRSPETIDEAKIENLIARFLLWHYATGLGIDADEALYPTKTWKTLFKQIDTVKEKSGALQQPDQILVTQLKREIEVMRASLLRLADLVPSGQEESSGQEVTYGHSLTDKTQSTGKR
jgi:hypothetical protein